MAEAEKRETSPVIGRSEPASPQSLRMRPVDLREPTGSVIRTHIALPEARPPQPALPTIRIERPRSVERLELWAPHVPEIAYELRDGSRVHVLLQGQVCRAMLSHGGESNHHGNEVGGLIVGYRHELPRHPDGPRDYLVIATDVIPFRSDDSSGAHLCLEPEAWQAVDLEFDLRFASQQKMKIGWYHTHPTQGIFFSGQDVDVHTIFTQPGQFAVVVDPRRRDAGLFYWDHLNRREVSAPIRFALERKRDGVRDAERTPPPRIAAPPRREEQAEACELRLFCLFVVTLFALFGLFILSVSVVNSAPGSRLARSGLLTEVGPLFVLLTLFWFVLWNGGFLHTEEENHPIRRRWGRLIAVAASLGGLGYGLVTPSHGLALETSRAVLILGLLGLLFLQTAIAGWYRTDEVWEESPLAIVWNWVSTTSGILGRIASWLAFAAGFVASIFMLLHMCDIGAAQISELHVFGMIGSVVTAVLGGYVITRTPENGGNSTWRQ